MSIHDLKNNIFLLFKNFFNLKETYNRKQCLIAAICSLILGLFGYSFIIRLIQIIFECSFIIHLKQVIVELIVCIIKELSLVIFLISLAPFTEGLSTISQQLWRLARRLASNVSSCTIIPLELLLNTKAVKIVSLIILFILLTVVITKRLNVFYKNVYLNVLFSGILTFLMISSQLIGYIIFICLIFQKTSISNENKQLKGTSYLTFKQNFVYFKQHLLDSKLQDSRRTYFLNLLFFLGFDLILSLMIGLNYFFGLLFSDSIDHWFDLFTFSLGFIIYLFKVCIEYCLIKRRLRDISNRKIFLTISSIIMISILLLKNAVYCILLMFLLPSVTFTFLLVDLVLGVIIGIIPHFDRKSKQI